MLQLNLKKATTAPSESRTKVFDLTRQAAAAVLVIAGLAGFYYFSEFSLLYRVLVLVFLFAGAVALLYTTEYGHRIWNFVQESRIEVRKVIWPSRQETQQTTLIVFVMVVIVGLVLWLLDMFLFWGVSWLTGQGG